MSVDTVQGVDRVTTDRSSTRHPAGACGAPGDDEALTWQLAPSSTPTMGRGRRCRAAGESEPSHSASARRSLSSSRVNRAHKSNGDEGGGRVPAGTSGSRDRFRRVTVRAASHPLGENRSNKQSTSGDWVQVSMPPADIKVEMQAGVQAGRAANSVGERRRLTVRLDLKLKWEHDRRGIERRALIEAIGVGLRRSAQTYSDSDCVSGLHDIASHQL